MRVCNVPGCPTPVESGRCTTHARSYERQRGTRQHRGYDAAHDRRRAEWQPLVDTGTVACWRCHNLIPAGSPWDLGHDDRDRTIYRGPEHATCNRATNGR